MVDRVASCLKKLDDVTKEPWERFQVLLDSLSATTALTPEEIGVMFGRHGRVCLSVYNEMVHTADTEYAQTGKHWAVSVVVELVKVLKMLLICNSERVASVGWEAELFVQEAYTYVHPENHSQVRRCGLELLAALADVQVVPHYPTDTNDTRWVANVHGALMSVLDWPVLAEIAPMESIYAEVVLPSPRHGFIPGRQDILDASRREDALWMLRHVVVAPFLARRQSIRHCRFWFHHVMDYVLPSLAPATCCQARRQVPAAPPTAMDVLLSRMLVEVTDRATTHESMLQHTFGANETTLRLAVLASARVLFALVSQNHSVGLGHIHGSNKTNTNNVTFHTCELNNEMEDASLVALAARTLTGLLRRLPREVTAAAGEFFASPLSSPDHTEAILKRILHNWPHDSRVAESFAQFLLAVASATPLSRTTRQAAVGRLTDFAFPLVSTASSDKELYNAAITASDALWAAVCVALPPQSDAFRKVIVPRLVQLPLKETRASVSLLSSSSSSLGAARYMLHGAARLPVLVASVAIAPKDSKATDTPTASDTVTSTVMVTVNGDRFRAVHAAVANALAVAEGLDSQGRAVIIAGVCAAARTLCAATGSPLYFAASPDTLLALFAPPKLMGGARIDVAAALADILSLAGAVPPDDRLLALAARGIAEGLDTDGPALLRVLLSCFQPRANIFATLQAHGGSVLRKLATVALKVLPLETLHTDSVRAKPFSTSISSGSNTDTTRGVAGSGEDMGLFLLQSKQSALLSVLWATSDRIGCTTTQRLHPYRDSIRPPYPRLFTCDVLCCVAMLELHRIPRTSNISQYMDDAITFMFGEWRAMWAAASVPEQSLGWMCALVEAFEVTLLREPEAFEEILPCYASFVMRVVALLLHFALESSKNESRGCVVIGLFAVLCECVTRIGRLNAPCALRGGLDDVQLKHLLADAVHFILCRQTTRRYNLFLPTDDGVPIAITGRTTAASHIGFACTVLHIPEALHSSDTNLGSVPIANNATTTSIAATAAAGASSTIALFSSPLLSAAAELADAIAFMSPSQKIKGAIPVSSSSSSPLDSCNPGDLLMQCGGVDRLLAIRTHSTSGNTIVCDAASSVFRGTWEVTEGRMVLQRKESKPEGETDTSTETTSHLRRAKPPRLVSKPVIVDPLASSLKQYAPSNIVKGGEVVNHLNKNNKLVNSCEPVLEECSFHSGRRELDRQDLSPYTESARLGPHSPALPSASLALHLGLLGIADPIHTQKPNSSAIGVDPSRSVCFNPSATSSLLKTSVCPTAWRCMRVFVADAPSVKTAQKLLRTFGSLDASCTRSTRCGYFSAASLEYAGPMPNSVPDGLSLCFCSHAFQVNTLIQRARSRATQDGDNGLICVANGPDADLSLIFLFNKDGDSFFSPLHNGFLLPFSIFTMVLRCILLQRHPPTSEERVKMTEQPSSDMTPQNVHNLASLLFDVADWGNSW